MIVRAYCKDDHFACIEIFKSNTPKFFAENELNDFEFWLNGKDQNVLAYQNTQEEYFYVLEHDGSVKACGGMYLPKNEQRINLVWGMVHSSMHLQGIGACLMQCRLDLANVLFPRIPITIDTTQHSSGFFEKFNFETVKTTEDFYANGLHRIDMVKIK
jgi:predicted GNAT family N-acyltransferase